MSLRVLAAGPQATVQGAPRSGLRHQGVPGGGPADALSMALANRLVGRPHWASALEIALGPAHLRFEVATWIAVTGAQAELHLDDRPAARHRCLAVAAGSELRIGPGVAGARSYLALSGVLAADAFLGSTSTYLPAGLGGHHGRALRAGDLLALAPGDPGEAGLETPPSLRPPLTRRWTLRVVPGPDWPDTAGWPVDLVFRAGMRMDRMGLALAGGSLPAVPGGAPRSSEAVFPGTVQGTPDGQAFLLLADGQTTGGYPHLLQVVRADRHLTGQVRPGDAVRLAGIDQAAAEAALAHKHALLAAWLPGFRLP